MLLAVICEYDVDSCVPQVMFVCTPGGECGGALLTINKRCRFSWSHFISLHKSSKILYKLSNSITLVVLSLIS